MAARRVNTRYSTREAVELVLHEGSDLEDVSDSDSEENIVYSGEEFVPVDLEADLSDSDNDIADQRYNVDTRKIKLFFILCLDSSCFAVATEKGMRFDYMDYLSDKYTS